MLPPEPVRVIFAESCGFVDPRTGECILDAELLPDVSVEIVPNLDYCVCLKPPLDT